MNYLYVHLALSGALIRVKPANELLPFRLCIAILPVWTAGHTIWSRTSRWLFKSKLMSTFLELFYIFLPGHCSSPETKLEYQLGILVFKLSSLAKAILHFRLYLSHCQILQVDLA